MGKKTDGKEGTEMTVSEIARKNGIPYNFVYEATYNVKPVDYFMYNEYDEEEIMRQVKKNLIIRRKKLVAKLRELNDIIASFGD